MKKRVIKPRRIWAINPRTRVKKSRKIYRRSKAKADARKAIDEK